MTPSNTQAAAIRAIVAWYAGGRSTPQEFYLAGFAGVGKSTVAAMAIAELREKCGVRVVETGTFTGKAANVLRKKGVPEAKTIHSMIYSVVEDPETGEVTFRLAPDSPAAKADLIVLDEVSMVSEEMADDLRSYGVKILVMGDPGQLPPVRGTGAFTSRRPDVFLTEIHRQAADSPILHLATLAREGRPIPTGDYGQDVRVLDLTRDTQHEVYRTDTQAICGVHRVRWVYTQRIRKQRGFEGPTPLAGERLICCKNAKDIGLFNGGLGDAIEPARPDPAYGTLRITAKMEDRLAPLRDAEVHPYLFQQHFIGQPIPRPRMHKGILEFDWGYLLTCHKAQGSEWPHVTIVDDSASFREDRAKWLYTAITRASSGLTLLKRAA